MWEYVGFLEREGRPKPAFYTYQLMISKLDGFTRAEKLEGDIYKFYFDNKEPVFVAWSDYGNKTIDLTDYVSTPTVKITHIVTELDGSKPAYIANETVSTNEVLTTEMPVFMEEKQ